MSEGKPAGMPISEQMRIVNSSANVGVQGTSPDSGFSTEGGMAGAFNKGQGEGLDQGIGSSGDLMAGLNKSSLDFGIGREPLTIFASQPGGVFEKNPLTDAFDGTLVGQGNINAFAGMGSYTGIGSLDLKGATAGETLNVAGSLSGLTNPQKGGEGQAQ